MSNDTDFHFSEQFSDLKQQVEKLAWQVRTIGVTIDSEAHPIESMVLALDLAERDLERIHDTFETYDNALTSGTPVDWGKFERTFRESFRIDYQSLKVVINSFYRNGQWSVVCGEYALAHKVSEFHRLIEDYSRWRKS